VQQDMGTVPLRTAAAHESGTGFTANQEPM
jgi:hypothetical protein